MQSLSTHEKVTKATFSDKSCQERSLKLIQLWDSCKKHCLFFKIFKDKYPKYLSLIHKKGQIFLNKE